MSTKIFAATRNISMLLIDVTYVLSANSALALGDGNIDWSKLTASMTCAALARMRPLRIYLRGKF